MDKLYIKEYIYVLRCIFNSCIVFCLLSINLNAQTSVVENPKHEAEDLWASIDLIKLRKDITAATQIPASDLDLFFKFLQQQYPDQRSDFFKQAERGNITQSNLLEYVNEMTLKYINSYPDFLKVKSVFALQQENSTINLPLSVNGPCENIGFETGTTTGWQGATGNACTSPTPCSIVNGFNATRHVITNATMADPYIPALSVVAPGGNFSLRLENYVNGGDASLVSQTFLVTPTNNIFTYQYAAVLEDPGDHNDNERPYFKVRMYDKNGNEITCASYTAIAKPPIQNFTYQRVLNPNYIPGSVLNNNQYLDLYYRDWTTITIPLLGYEGQNVTVEFIASDCSRGGHLGYAYIDASCSFLDTKIPPTICGTENVTLYGPDNFDQYEWNGPGVTGSKTTQNITVNKSGIYTLKLTPLADYPCPITVSTTVPERCLPVPINKSLCETTKGSGIATGINLTDYNTAITSYNNLAQVLEWHSGKPATTANKIGSPTNINVSNGSKYYAVIKYSTAGFDTAQINFKVNSLPVIQFPSVGPLCKSTTPFTIAGVQPSGGIFKGSYTTTTGIFTPSTAGTFPITYTVTNASGCTDSATTSIVVNAPPTIHAGADQKLCSTTTSVVLTATGTNAITTNWTGGTGTFTNDQALQTTYTPSAAEINSGSITLKVTASGTSPCNSVSDNVLLIFIPTPSVNAGPDQDLCMDAAMSVALAGTSTYDSIVTWSGGSGKFLNSSASATHYSPSASELSTGSVTLTLTALGNSPCTSISDDIQVRFHDLPIAAAGPDTIVCKGTLLTLSAQTQTGLSYNWSNRSGTTLSSASGLSLSVTVDSMLFLTVTNQFGCHSKDTVNIIAYSQPLFNLGGPYCFSNQLTLNANPSVAGTAQAILTWKKNGQTITNQNNYTLNVTEDGQYTILFKYGGCNATASTDVFMNPVLDTPDSYTKCEGTNVSANTSNISGASYIWTNNGNIIPGNTNSISISTITGKQKYYVQVTDIHNCKAVDSFQITGIPIPIVYLKDTSICADQSVIVHGEAINASQLQGYQIKYEWQVNNAPSGNVQSYYTANVAGTYEVKVSVEECSGDASMHLKVNPLPVLNLPASARFCPESDGDMVIDAGAANSYIWQPNGESSRSIKVTHKGIYSVTVTNSYNCSNSAKTEIREICPPRLFVADAFSPNHDGINDLFNVYGVHIGKYHLLIFNRWGEVIFESLDKDYPWNGIYKEDLMPIGVYPWVITYEGDSDEYKGPYKMEGSVTVVK
jgi:gliding motility-associated-like protein